MTLWIKDLPIHHITFRGTFYDEIRWGCKRHSRWNLISEGYIMIAAKNNSGLRDADGFFERGSNIAIYYKKTKRGWQFYTVT